MKLKDLLLFVFIGTLSFLNSQTNVEIRGNALYYDQTRSLTYIVGNVWIKHDGVIITCDSAIRNTALGVMEGFGNVYVYQPDTFNLSGGQYLKYDEKSKNAFVLGPNVVLSDKNMTLTTTSINYNTISQMGYYTNKASIINEQNNLVSQKGYYYKRSSEFHFKNNVELRHPEYTMYSDTLIYKQNTQTAFFYGPTTIISGENTIKCNYGWYDTKRENAQFSKRASIISGANTISADSLLYNKKEEIGIGYRNIELVDTIEKFKVYGHKGIYYQKTKESYISNNPSAVQFTDDDTMYLLADTFYFLNDSTQRQLRAYSNTKLIQKDFQSISDSLIYLFNDSTIQLFKNPIIWNKKTQITGDTVRLLLKNKKPFQMYVNEKAFLISEINNSNYNQIKGKEMLINFKDNKISSVNVKKNAEAIYYITDNETDSAEYSGVNKIKSEHFVIYFDSSKVSNIRFYSFPEGKMYPPKEFPESESKLDNFIWKIDLKPQINEFEERRKYISPSPKVEIIPKKESKKKKKK